jgi:hypothetical protein
MKWKIALAILGIAVVSAVLFAATVSAFTPNANSSNSPTSTNGPYRFGPHWFDDDSRGDFGEGGMMNGWGPFAQNSTGGAYFDDEWWSGHE